MIVNGLSFTYPVVVAISSRKLTMKKDRIHEVKKLTDEIFTWHKIQTLIYRPLIYFRFIFLPCQIRHENAKRNIHTEISGTVWYDSNRILCLGLKV